MPSAPFHILDSVEKAFFDPNSVSILEALASPSKTRVSVRGIVESISDEIPTSNTKRRILICKTVDDIKLVIKLWGNKTCLEIPPKDSVVKITHLEMTEYLGRKEANSTSLTEIIIEGDEKEMTEEIEAACFDSGNMCIILNRQEYMCNETNLVKAFPDMKFVAGVICKIVVKGSRIVSLERIESKAKKSKKE